MAPFCFSNLAAGALVFLKLHDTTDTYENWPDHID